MEIKEIISYYLNGETNMIEVSFRTIDDEEDVLRNDTIDYSIVEEYGFNLVTESFDFFGDDEDDFEGGIFEHETIELDEDELIVFLNEYYLINPVQLPKSEFYQKLLTIYLNNKKILKMMNQITSPMMR